LFGAVVVLALFVAVCGVAVAQEEAAPAAPVAPVEKQGPTQTIYEIAQVRGFNQFCKAVEAAGLVDALNAEGPLTVIIPSDAAFTALGEEKLTALMADAEALKKVLNNHIIPGKRLMWQALAEASPLTTAAGTQLIGTREDVDVDGVPTPLIKVQGIEVKKATRTFAKNGMLYSVDTILPEAAAAAEAAPVQ